MDDTTGQRTVLSEEEVFDRIENALKESDEYNSYHEKLDAVKENQQEDVDEIRETIQYVNRFTIINSVDCIVGILVMILTTLTGCNIMMEHPEIDIKEILQKIVIAEVGVFLIIPAYTLVLTIISRISARRKKKGHG